MDIFKLASVHLPYCTVKVGVCMDFQMARHYLTDYGLQMVRYRHGGVAAVAIGNGEGGPIAGATDFSLALFVPRKLSTRELDHHSVMPVAKLLSCIMGPSTRMEPLAPGDLDVIECGSAFEPLQFPGLCVPAANHAGHSARPGLHNQKWFSSLRLGIGITNPENQYPNILSVGTLGFGMIDSSGDRYIVSNNHVIGGSNAASHGEPIVQPGTLDLTAMELSNISNLVDLSNKFKIAELEAFVPLRWMDGHSTPVNTVDAAIARLNNERDSSELDRLCFSGCIMGVAVPYTLDPTTGALQGSERVYKLGRTTGFTEGRVTHVLGTATIQYPGGGAYFTNQVIIQATPDNVGPFSDAGDSGSGVFNDRHELVGLLFAGTSAPQPSQQITMVNPIDEVVSSLRQITGNSGLQVINA